jgi:hypothetical protein
MGRAQPKASATFDDLIPAARKLAEEKASVEGSLVRRIGTVVIVGDHESKRALYKTECILLRGRVNHSTFHFEPGSPWRWFMPYIF